MDQVGLLVDFAWYLLCTFGVNLNYSETSEKGMIWEHSVPY